MKEMRNEKIETAGGVMTVMYYFYNPVAGYKAELTRMTAKSGTIVYAVIVRNLTYGRRTRRANRRIYKFEKLGEAFKQFKRATGEAA